MIDLNELKRFASFFSQVMGSQTEVVIHDITTGEILWIANGSITNRCIGMHEESITLQMIMNEVAVAETDNMRVGYQSATHRGLNLRSSQIFLRDSDDNIRYVMCVNQDLSSLTAMQTYLNAICNSIHFGSSTSSITPSQTDDQTIDSVTTQVILKEIERAKPFTLDSKEARTNILRGLDEKGVFEVRYAVAKTCELLQIAQATLYKYLKEIRSTPPNGNQEP